jgi:DNA-directed RNA polymerase specialized sigma24 family protein
MRLAVLAAVLTAATAVVASIPHADLFDGPSIQQVVLETAAALLTLLAAFLIFARMRRNSDRSELVLVTALTVIALSNILFVVLPELIGSATANAAQWAAIIGRLSGSLLFALAAFVPPGALRRPRQAEGLAVVSAFGVVLLAAAIPHALGSKCRRPSRRRGSRTPATACTSRRRWPSRRRFAVHVLGDPALAEEMVLEVFQRLCRCAATYDGRPDRPGAFLFRLAGSVAADIRGRQPPGPRPDGAGLPPLPAVDQVLDTLALRAALGQLSSPYAEVLSLAIKERRTHADVARRLGMPVEDAGTLLRHLPPAVEPPPGLRARTMAGVRAGAAPRVSLPPPELARLAQVRPGSLLETAS